MPRGDFSNRWDGLRLRFSHAKLTKREARARGIPTARPNAAAWRRCEPLLRFPHAKLAKREAKGVVQTPKGSCVVISPVAARHLRVKQLQPQHGARGATDEQPLCEGRGQTLAADVVGYSRLAGFIKRGSRSAET